jgi:hypothetical protein
VEWTLHEEEEGRWRQWPSRRWKQAGVAHTAEMKRGAIGAAQTGRFERNWGWSSREGSARVHASQREKNLEHDGVLEDSRPAHGRCGSCGVQMSARLFALEAEPPDRTSDE